MIENVRTKNLNSSDKSLNIPEGVVLETAAPLSLNNVNENQK